MSNNTEYCRTELQWATTKQFIWTIDNFRRSVRCSSEIFKAIDADGKELECQLHIVPRDEVESGPNANEYIALYVVLNPYKGIQDPHPNRATDVNANLQVAIKNSNGEEVFEKNMFIEQIYPYWFNSFLKKDILFDPKYGLLPGGKLTIVCKIENVKAVKYQRSEGLPEINVPEGLNKAEIGKMHLSGCTIVSADNKKLKANKNILACHSPVFAAMFEHSETIESQNNEIRIPDFEANVLKQMLQYMYDENAMNCTNIEDKLLAAAEKYGLERLKALCERDLAHSMAVDNACEILILATLHSAEQLKLYAIAYIKKHEQQVKASDGWELLDEEHLLMLGIDE